LWAKVNNDFCIEHVVEEWNYSKSIIIQNIPSSLTISDLWERTQTLWSQALKTEEEEEKDDK